MIIYGLLKIVLIVLQLISSVLGALIPDFPSTILNILDTINTMVYGGLSFISYFLFWPVVVSMLSLILAFHVFKISKDSIMKVLGHFIGN